MQAELERTLEQKRQVEGYGDRDNPQASEQRLREQAHQEMEAEADRERERLDRVATDRLEGHLADVSRELNQAVNRATAEALKQKAAQLGRIKEMADDPETGSLTIVVEV